MASDGLLEVNLTPSAWHALMSVAPTGKTGATSVRLSEVLRYRTDPRYCAGHENANLEVLPMPGALPGTRPHPPAKYTAFLSAHDVLQALSEANASFSDDVWSRW